MRRNNRQKITSTLILVGMASLIAFTTILATTPLHEACHWVMSEYFDPYIKPVEFHVFDETAFNNGEHLLASALGCVIVEETYPGAFNDRPAWADSLQEIICVSVQIIIACIVILKSLKLLVKKFPNLLETY